MATYRIKTSGGGTYDVKTDDPSELDSVVAEIERNEAAPKPEPSFFDNVVGSVKDFVVGSKKSGSVLEDVTMADPQLDPELNRQAMLKSGSPDSVMFTAGRGKQSADAQVAQGKRVLNAEAAAANAPKTDRSVGDYAGDLALSTTKIAPTVLKNVADVGNLVTLGQLGLGDVSKYINDALPRIEKRFGSDAAKAERKALQRVMGDRSAGAIDVAAFVLSNPMLAADMGITTVGSLAVPLGATKLASKLAGPLSASTATGVANASNVLMNAGDTFSATAGSLLDKANAAAIAGAGTYLGGKLTGGGLEGQMARQAVGQNATMTGLRSAAKEALVKEPLQEYIEGVSQAVGQDLGERRPADFAKANKEGAMGAVIAPLVAGPISGANAAANAKIEPTLAQSLVAQAERQAQTGNWAARQQAPRVENQPTTPQAPAPNVAQQIIAAEGTPAAAFESILQREGLTAPNDATTVQQTPAVAQQTEIAPNEYSGAAAPQMAQASDPVSRLRAEMEAIKSKGTANVVTSDQTQQAQPTAQAKAANAPVATNLAAEMAAIKGNSPAAQIGQALPATDIAATNSTPAASAQSAPIGVTLAKKPAGGKNLRKASYAKNPLLTFLAQHGLYHDRAQSGSLKSEFSPDRQVMVGGYGPVFKKTGMRLDALLPLAIQDGFVSPNASESELYSLVQKAVSGERIAPMFAEGVTDQEIAAMIDSRAEAEPDFDSVDPFNDLDFVPDDFDVPGYSEAADPIKQEVNALLAQAAALGIDVDTITEDAHYATREQSEQAYYEAVKRALTTAIAAQQGSNRTGSADSGKEGYAAEEGLSSYTPADVLARQSAQEQAQRQDATQQRDIEQRSKADAQRNEFTLTGSDRTADANPAQGLMFSRGASTQSKYESRIDALFSGDKAGIGTRVLDRSDVMGMLGYPDVPLILNERHLLDGLSTHPEMTAKAWKMVPDWLENPAMVYSDKSESGRLVVIAPKDIAGYPVMLVVEPKPTPSQRGASADFQLLVTVYAKTNGSIPSPASLASNDRLLYIDKANAPAVLQRAGVQFSGQIALQQGRVKILTEKNLSGWRKAHTPKYSFAGRNAATANLGPLEQANQRIEAGEDAEAVRMETGWHKGVDGKWRFEISDKGAFFKGTGTFGEIVMRRLGALTASGDRKQDDPIRLEDVLYHSQLFDAYPALRQLEVEFTQKGSSNHASLGSDGVIRVRESLTSDKALSAILHEIQHAIQEREGFASGGDADTAAMNKVRDINKSLSWITKEKDSIKAMQYEPGADSKKIKDQLHQLDVYYRQLLDERANIDHFGTYKRLAGEVEARNTQARAGMDDAQRIATSPSQTQDVPDADQIVRYGRGKNDFKPRNLDQDITLDIPVEGGKTAKLTVNAKTYIADLEAREDALTMVKECFA